MEKGMINNDYVSITYAPTRTPKSDYPNMMAAHLKTKFGLKAESDFLEIGCGRGDFLRAFNNLGFRCRAVDLAKSSVDFNQTFDAKLVDVSRESLPYPDNSFDVVYSKSVLEHMWDGSFLMSEARRVLRPNGVCITLVPDWVSQMDVFYEDYTHCRPYTTDSLKDLMCAVGFTDVKTEFFRQYPPAWNSRVVRWLCRCAGTFLSTTKARSLTRISGKKFFRWSVELMILGIGRK